MTRATFRLLTLPSNPTDSTSFYRCMGPLTALRRHRKTLVHVLEQNIRWDTVAHYDAALMQRPSTPNCAQIARKIVQTGAPLWVDFDDNLFDVPRDNPHHEKYAKPEAKRAARAVLSLADVVTVTTTALRDVLAPFAHTVRVVPNALMTNIVGNVPDHNRKKRTPLVLWRGTSTHQRDLETYGDEMIAVAARHPMMRFTFLGYNPWRITEAIGPRQASSSPWVDQLEYFALVAALRPKVMVVPLADHSFNRCKSNIAAIEAIYAGAVVVVPDWPEWQIPGALRYTDKPSFDIALEQACSMSAEEQNARWSEGRDYVNQRLLIDSVNGARAQILNELEVRSGDESDRARRRELVAPELVIEPEPKPSTPAVAEPDPTIPAEAQAG